MDPVLELWGLSKVYRAPWTGKTVPALAGLDLTAQPGQVVGLLGPNGSGKSTTFKLILGLIRPTSGRARVFGWEAGAREARRRLGFMPENPGFPRFLRGTEVLRFYGRLSGLGGAALDRAVRESVAQAGLGAAAERPVHGYSKGMLQRLALAQALLHDPDLLLLDEPTAGVDPAGAREIRALIAALRGRGKTILFSSHLLDEVEAVADRVVLLDRGRKIVEGTLPELLAVPDRTEISVRGLPEEERAAVEVFLRERGGQEIAFHPARRTLEEFFLRRTEERR